MNEAEYWELDMQLGEALRENKELRGELEQALAERDTARSNTRRLEEALERILAVSRVALWDSRPERTSQVGTQERTCEVND